MPLFDSFRRAIGIPTVVELGEARRERSQVERSEIPQDKYARAVADVVAPMSPDRAREAFPGLKVHPWPEQEDLRWKIAADMARNVADESLKKPVSHVDAALSKAIGEEALLEAAERFTRLARHRLNKDETAENTLEASRKLVSNSVHSFMSTGVAAEHNAREQASALSSTPGQREWYDLRRDVEGLMKDPTSSTMREWTLEASRTRIAMAQTGVLSPGRTVRAAMDAAGKGHQIHGPVAQTPGRASAALSQGEERAAIVRRQMDSNALEANPPKPPVLTTEEHLARQGITNISRAQIQQGLNDPSRGR